MWQYRRLLEQLLYVQKWCYQATGFCVLVLFIVDAHRVTSPGYASVQEVLRRTGISFADFFGMRDYPVIAPPDEDGVELLALRLVQSHYKDSAQIASLLEETPTPALGHDIA